jgi:cytochrome bd-type quinol oxidase subunit 2
MTKLFNISSWWALVFFTLPCLFFSQVPAVIAFLYFSFYVLLFLYLKNVGSTASKHTARARIGSIFLGLFFLTGGLMFVFGLNTNNFKYWRPLISILYFLVSLDIAVFLSRLWLNSESRSVGMIFLMFLSLLVPPLGFYYLRALYRKSTLRAAEKQAADAL